MQVYLLAAILSKVILLYLILSGSSMAESDIVQKCYLFKIFLRQSAMSNPINSTFD